ncbi:MAG: hypothetical protein MZV63_19420 [Marinilabiliales bacterium]|nr:hypothetical protein [Marinilabiliales bacterium]
MGGNAVLTFVGWEVAGLCSYLLVSFFQDRPTATANATRVFVTNRIGDAGFLLGIALSFHWLGSTDWETVTSGVGGFEFDAGGNSGRVFPAGGHRQVGPGTAGAVAGSRRWRVRPRRAPCFTAR